MWERSCWEDPAAQLVTSSSSRDHHSEQIYIVPASHQASERKETFDDFNMLNSLNSELIVRLFVSSSEQFKTSRCESYSDIKMRIEVSEKAETSTVPE